MRRQSRLDLTELHAITVSFDHSVATPVVDIVARWLLDHDVAGAIPFCTGGVHKKGPRILFGEIPVPLHHGFAAHDELTLVADTHLAPVGIDDATTHVRAAFADRVGLGHIL